MSDNNQIPNNPMEHEFPTLEKPGFEVPPQPAQFTQPEFEQPTYGQPQNGQSQYGQPQNSQPQFDQPYNYGGPTNEAPKKKGKKKLAGAIAAIVGIAACVCVAVFAGPKIIAALSKDANKAPIDRFKSAITETSKELSDNLKNSPASSMKADNVKADVTFDVTMGEYLTAMLPAEYSSINNVGGNLSVISKDQNQYINLALTSKNTPVASMEVYLDQPNSMGYIKIPDLSPDYLSVSMDSLGNYFNSSVSNNTTMDPAELANLFTEETEVFLSKVETVDLEEDVKVEAGDVTSKYDKLSTTLKGQELIDVSSDILKKFMENDSITKIIEQSMAASGYTGSIDDMLEQALTELDSLEADNSDKLTIDLYVDDDDKITGIVLTVGSDGSNGELGFVTAKDDETGFEFYVDVDSERVLNFDGSYTEKSDVYNGKATLEVSESGITQASADLTFENVSCGKDKFEGTFTLVSPQLMGATLKLDLKCENKHSNIALDVTMAGSSIITATFDVTASEADSCPTVPTDAVIYDAVTENNEYMSNADYMGFMQKIQDATGIDLMSLFYGTSDY